MPEYLDSKFNCIEGHIGPLCESCDVFGTVWKSRFGEVSYLNCMSCDF